MDKDFRFHPQDVDAAYVNTLTDFIVACRANSVDIDRVRYFENGWVVTFSGCEDADAICHDGSYGSPCYFGITDDGVHTNDWGRFGEWETIGFPWDKNGTSTHTSEVLARLIGQYQRGEYKGE